MRYGHRVLPRAVEGGEAWNPPGPGRFEGEDASEHEVDLEQQHGENIADLHESINKLLSQARQDLQRAPDEFHRQRLNKVIAQAERVREYERRTSREKAGQENEYVDNIESEYDRTIRRSLLPHINLDAIEKGRSRATAQRTRERVATAVQQAFTRNDPLPTRDEEGKLHGDRAFARRDQAKALVDLITASHHASTPDARELASRRAQRLLSQMSLQAQGELNKRRETVRARELGYILQGGEEGRFTRTPDPSYLLHDHTTHRTVPSGTTEAPGKGQVTYPAGQDVEKGLLTLNRDLANAINEKRHPDEIEKIRKEQKRVKDQYDDLSQRFREQQVTDREAVRKRLAHIPTEGRLGNTLAGPPTAEEVYRLHQQGTDTTAPHNRLLRPFHKVRRDFGLVNRLNKNQYRAGISGDLVAGVGPDKRRSTMQEATIGIGPNKKWRYALNVNPEILQRNSDLPPIESKELDYWDTKTRWHRPVRDSAGRIVEGDWDQLRSERLVKKQSDPFQFQLGKRTAEVGRRPDHIEEDRFVPVPGLSRKSTKILRGEGKTQTDVTEVLLPGDINLARATGVRGGENRWVPTDELPPDLKAIGIRTRTVRRNKDIRVHYVPSDQVHLNSKEKDVLSFRIPPIKLGTKTVKVERTTPRGGDMDLPGGTDVLKDQGKFVKEVQRPRINIGERLGYIRLDESTDRQKALNKLLFEPKRAYEYQQLVQRSVQEAEKRDTESRPESHTRSFVGAGLTAGGYGVKRTFKEGYLPQHFNMTLDVMRNKHPKLDKLMREHRLKGLAVNQALLNPMAEKYANLKLMLQHPTLAIHEGIAGVQVGNIRYREWGIKEKTFQARRLERANAKIDRIANTVSWFEEHGYPQNLGQRVVVGRKDYTLHLKDYQEFMRGQGPLAEGASIARDVRANAAVWPELERSANELHAKVQKIRSRLATDKVMSDQTRDRVRDWKGGMELDVPRGRKFATEVSLKGRGEPQRVIVNQALDERLAKVMGDHKTALIGGAALATAAGAHYTYHRYKQSKLPPEERTAYYNKVLPPAFNVPVPSVRRTGFIRTPDNFLTREFHADNKRMGVRLGVGYKKKRIALRPSEQHDAYDKNLPLIGNFKSGATPGGSRIGSFLHDPEVVYNRKRNFTSKRNTVMVKGKETPFYVSVGSQKRVKMSATNPQRLKQEDREQIVWASAGTDDEKTYRNFYASDKRLQDMYEDPDEISRLRRKLGTQEAKAFASAAEQMRRSRAVTAEGRAYTGTPEEPIPEEGIAMPRETEQDKWNRRRALFEEHGIEWR